MTRLMGYVFCAALIFGMTACSRSTGDQTASTESTKTSADGKKTKKRAKKTEEKEVIINVEAAQMVRGEALSAFNTTTIVEADKESAVTSKAGGIVLSINVEVGDKVQQGDVLAVLESDQQKLRLQSANANYQKSLHNYNRAKTLLKKGLANQESVDNLKFETQSLKTSLDQAQMDIDFTNITAPISGVITNRNIKKGNLIQINTSAYEIVDFGSLQAVINVPENKWGLFEEDLSVIFDFTSINHPVYGRILRIDPIVDSTTGTFRVVIAFDETKAKLRPGLFGKAQIVLDKHDEALLVDKDAVIREDKNAFVFVINDDNTVSKTLIELGYQMPDHIEVLKGLSEQQSVVTTGKNNLSTGSKIAVINYDD